MKNKKSSIAIFILSLTSFACNNASGEGSALAGDEGPTASLGADKVNSCTGTEPFWGLKIS